MTYYFIILGPEEADELKDDPELKDIYRLIRQYFKEYNKEAYLKKSEVLSSYLNILKIKTDNTQLPVAAQEDSYNRENFRQFQKFIALLEHDLNHTHKVADYSQKIGITSRKLSSICQSCKGKSPKKIINEYLVSESKRLLINTSYSIKQVAMQLGFADQYQFSKYFKKHEKLAPAIYRRKRNQS
jgi:AraC family transcriptional regulator, transcriptional activator of pobA